MSAERWIVTTGRYGTYRAQTYQVISETAQTVKDNQPGWDRPSTFRKPDILAWFDNQASADALVEKVTSSAALADEESRNARIRHIRRVEALIGATL